MMRVLSVFGTRPEAIKMAPVIRELSKAKQVESRVCVTAQHREMLDQMLDLFDIEPDIDLDLMQPGQTLSELTSRVLISMTEVLENVEPDCVLVQGDTTTVMATSLAGFYQRIPVGHVEAGLRTGDRYRPFPEEINRRVAGVVASHHFAPTERAQQALLAEGIHPNRVFLTGNTIVDAIRWIGDMPLSEEAGSLLENLGLGAGVDKQEAADKKLILVTAHRRESFGARFESLCRGLRNIVERNKYVCLVYPVHLNPQVRKPVNRILGDHPRIHLLEPLSYESFIRLMDKSYMVLTDSGGVQEEASVMGKPLLVLRDVTERPEIIETGVAKLVGTDEERIVSEAEKLLTDRESYRSMAKQADLFGDGHAAERIVHILLRNG